MLAFLLTGLTIGLHAIPTAADAAIVRIDIVIMLMLLMVVMMMMVVVLLLLLLLLLTAAGIRAASVVRGSSGASRFAINAAVGVVSIAFAVGTIGAAAAAVVAIVGGIRGLSVPMHACLETF